MRETGCMRRDTTDSGHVPDIYVTPEYVRGDTPPFGERPDTPGARS